MFLVCAQDVFVCQDTVIIYRLHVPLWHVLTSSLLHPPQHSIDSPAQDPSSPFYPLRDVLLQHLVQWQPQRQGSPTITLVVISIEGVWTPGRRSGDFCVGGFEIWGFLEHYIQLEKENRASSETRRQKSWGDNRPARRSALEEHHYRRYHRPRALRKAPACEVPSVEEARS